MRRDYFLFISAFVMDFCTGLVSFAVPLRALDMGASVVELGFIGTAGSLSFTVACTFTGKLADRFDRRRLMTISAGLDVGWFSVCSFLAMNYWMLLVRRGPGLGTAGPLLADSAGNSGREPQPGATGENPRNVQHVLDRGVHVGTGGGRIPLSRRPPWFPLPPV